MKWHTGCVSLVYTSTRPNSPQCSWYESLNDHLCISINVLRKDEDLVPGRNYHSNLRACISFTRRRAKVSTPESTAGLRREKPIILSPAICIMADFPRAHKAGSRSRRDFCTCFIPTGHSCVFFYVCTRQHNVRIRSLAYPSILMNVIQFTGPCALIGAYHRFGGTYRINLQLVLKGWHPHTRLSVVMSPPCCNG
jgi:hypothetical protein